MEESLRKTGENRYEVLVDGRSVGEVWNWHGSWSARTGTGEAHHGLKSRKQAVARVHEERDRR